MSEEPLIDEGLRRWRLILGGGDADGTGVPLDAADEGMDRTLQGLYEGERRGGLGTSAPSLARWLGDIRRYFPTPVVRVLQQDAIDRLQLTQLLLEPELLQTIEPDVQLVATLLSLNRLMPERTRETARAVVKKVVDELEQRLASPLTQAVQGALQRSTRNRRPRYNELDWIRTIQQNLRHYQPRYRTVIPERLVGYGHKRSSLKQIILCVDQSGSMATSVVYSGIFAAVLASLPALSTQLVVFDTAVVDLTDKLHDPVDLLFGTRLGGGTDIQRALAWCQAQVRSPEETLLVLISDLFEGGNRRELHRRVAGLLDAGVTMVTLLALNDEGAPVYDHENANAFAALGVPAFACTPQLFPELMAALLRKEPLEQWAGRWEVALKR